jgi:hypothetical protein
VPTGEDIAARRTSRKRRPLTELAQRSPLQALVAVLIRSALLGAIAVIGYVVIMNVLLPGTVDGFSETIRNQSR